MQQRQCREDFHKSESSCCVASQRLIVCGRRTGRDWFLNKYAVREHVYLFGAIRVSVGRNVAAVESCQHSDRFSHRLQFARETAGDSRPLPHGVRSNAGILIIYNFFEWAAPETSCCERRSQVAVLKTTKKLPCRRHRQSGQSRGVLQHRAPEITIARETVCWRRRV